jgi:hypothetical protein
MIIDDKIDALDTMYPSYAFICNDKCFFSDMNYSNLFGYAIDNTSIGIGDKVYNLNSGNYCSIFIKLLFTIFINKKLFNILSLFQAVQILDYTDPTVDPCENFYEFR